MFYKLDKKLAKMHIQNLIRGVNDYGFLPDGIMLSEIEDNYSPVQHYNSLNAGFGNGEWFKNRKVFETIDDFLSFLSPMENVEYMTWGDYLCNNRRFMVTEISLDATEGYLNTGNIDIIVWKRLKESKKPKVESTETDIKFGQLTLF